MKINKVLVTGGTGYIGSHTVLRLLESGYEVTVIDNLSNSSVEVLDSIKKLTKKTAKFYRIDLLNKAELENVFAENKFDAVIHLAAYKAVGESVTNPLMYYDNNLISTLNVLSVMKEFNINNFVFASSATVYGDPKKIPITEDEAIKPESPYANTKAIIESIMKDLSKEKLNSISLRFFNPLGAHPSGEIGEEPSGIPKNLAPFIAQVAIGKIEKLKVFGNDYPTKDGTCIRDYLHVMDLAEAFVCALRKLDESPNGYEAFNIGSGSGYSVFDIVHAFEKCTGKKINYEIIGRRPGDVPELRADSKKANHLLKWQQTKNLDEMCRDTWKWQSSHPNGYESK